MEVVDEALEFISESSSPGSFTLEPMNEPADRNGDDDLGMAVFGTPEALSDDAASYVLSCWQAVLARVKESGLDVAVMFQSFKLPDIGLAGSRAGTMWSSICTTITSRAGRRARRICLTLFALMRRTSLAM
jgi:hypothetical protein